MVEILNKRRFLTFGGNETYMLYVQGFPLREFCAFEIVDSDDAWQQLERGLLQPIADAAASNGFGLLTDCMVWRASADYVERLGAGAVADVNARAVARTRQFVDTWKKTSDAARACPVILAADHGPRGDGYAVSGPVTPDAAYEYHAQQVEALARANADLLVLLTMTSLGETLGIMRAARAAGLPALVSPTIEPDGTLPDGTPLGELITQVDEVTSGEPVAYMVNCAHPAHLEPHLRAAADSGAAWLPRFRGLRANASTKTHVELDNSTELDRGDIARLEREMGALVAHHDLRIVGGCCGTDAEHLQRIAAACAG